MLSVIFELDTGQLTEDQIALVASLPYHETAERNGKQMFEAVIPSVKVIPQFKALLADRKPVIVGVWNKEGTQYGTKYIQVETGVDKEGQPTYEQQITDALDENGKAIEKIPFDKTAYLNLLPDIMEYDTDGNVTKTTRPTVPTEVHVFAGWGNKVF